MWVREFRIQLLIYLLFPIFSFFNSNFYLYLSIYLFMYWLFGYLVFGGFSLFFHLFLIFIYLFVLNPIFTNAAELAFDDVPTRFRRIIGFYRKFECEIRVQR